MNENGCCSSHLFRFHVLLQVGPTQSPVPVVSNVTTVHDLTKQVAQVSPGNLTVHTITE